MPLSATTPSGLLAAIKTCSAFDVVVLVYAFCVALVIISFQWNENNSGKGRRVSKFKYNRSVSPAKLRAAAGEVSASQSRTTSTPPAANWKKEFEGVWLQYKEENFDNFLKFSGTSFALRKVIPVAFYMTRHTLSVTSVKTNTPSVGCDCDGQEQEEKEEEFFTVKRDFGEGVREWTLTMKIGADQQSAERVRAVIDTDEEYEFQNWADPTQRCLSTLSTPVQSGAGVRCVQTRTLIDRNEIRMTFDGYNLGTGETCEMVSYFKRAESS